MAHLIASLFHVPKVRAFEVDLAAIGGRSLAVLKLESRKIWEWRWCVARIFGNPFSGVVAQGAIVRRNFVSVGLFGGVILDVAAEMLNAKFHQSMNHCGKEAVLHSTGRVGRGVYFDIDIVASVDCENISSFVAHVLLG